MVGGRRGGKVGQRTSTEAKAAAPCSPRPAPRQPSALPFRLRVDSWRGTSGRAARWLGLYLLFFFPNAGDVAAACKACSEEWEHHFWDRCLGRESGLEENEKGFRYLGSLFFFFFNSQLNAGRPLTERKRKDHRDSVHQKRMHLFLYFFIYRDQQHGDLMSLNSMKQHGARVSVRHL